MLAINVKLGYDFRLILFNVKLLFFLVGVKLISLIVIVGVVVLNLRLYLV